MKDQNERKNSNNFNNNTDNLNGSVHLTTTHRKTLH